LLDRTDLAAEEQEWRGFAELNAAYFREQAA
jgi:hypothetical protein